MVLGLFFGLIAGYILAIPPGPIGMASIRTGLRDGWSAALKLALGAGLFDVAYCALAMVAASAVASMFDDVAHTTPWMPLALQLLIVAVMIAFGVVQLRDRTQAVSDDSLETQSAVLKWFRTHGPFFVGVGFAIANLANPTFIPSLMFVTTLAQNAGVYESTTMANLMFAIGFGIGNMAWLATLVRIVLAYRHRMTPSFVTLIQRISGAALIGFGTFYGVRLLIFTKWSEVLRLAVAL
jgi:threonine/homoserine/homoserine lactone efflux protein